jgi:anti-sigma regulatory factor (Ser/Thr protein kinase)
MAVARDDHVRLSLPARHEYARIARIGVAALALRLGFSYREIEDLRLAVDETLIFLLGVDRPGERITIRYSTRPDVLTLTATTSYGTEADDSARDRFETLIADLVDSWSSDEASGAVTFTKRHRHPAS